MSDDEPIPDEPIPSLAEALTEIRRLRARIAELEANAAITFGTLEQPTPDEPAVIEHNIPPNAPAHDEKPAAMGQPAPGKPQPDGQQ